MGAGILWPGYCHGMHAAPSLGLAALADQFCSALPSAEGDILHGAAIYGLGTLTGATLFLHDDWDLTFSSQHSYVDGPTLRQRFCRT